MAKDKPGNTPPTLDGSAIPLLESIVIPGTATPQPGKKSKKMRMESTPASAPPLTPTPAAPLPPVAERRAPKQTAEEQPTVDLSDLVGQDIPPVLDETAPQVTVSELPALIADVVQPEINAVYDEIKAVTQGLETRILQQLRLEIQTVSDKAETVGRQAFNAKPLVDAIKRIQDETRTLMGRADSIDGRTSSQIAHLNDKLEYLTQSLETKLKERQISADTLDERWSHLTRDLKQTLGERATQIDRLRDQVARLQGELATLHRTAAMAHQTEADVAGLRADIAALRDGQQHFMATLEDQLNKAFLRRIATLPKLVENLIRIKTQEVAADRVQSAPTKTRVAPPPPMVAKAAPQPKPPEQVQPVMMEKTFEPAAIEQRWYDVWEKNGYFAANEAEKSYCIMIPPPNVTGSLHMGHAFQDTIMDTLIRFHRMQGESTLWQAGTDHAGIATQMVVERQLAAKGKSRHDLGREAFIKQIWNWKNESGGMITKQLRRLGASLDWSRERFTMDAGLSKAVHEVFVQLYEEGLIYRGKRLVNWDPVLHTALSDLEVIAQEETGSLWHIRYPLTDEPGHLIVATTRPETLLGDCAVAVHPDDERYAHLIGKLVELPLANRRIPIIADTYVDPAFGTGCVKITPAHDFNDYQVWLRHKDTEILRTAPFNGLINIFTIDAKIKSSARDDDSMIHRAPAGASGSESGESGKSASTVDLIPEAYRGLDRFEARKRIIADLGIRNLVDKTVKHTLMVPRGDRSQAIVEPYLTDQWFVHAKPLAAPAIRAVENGDIKFVPESWANTYFDWMRNIEDWCISRQIWWGHRIPAWYDRRGNVYVGRSEAEVRKKHDLPSMVPLVQDPDVLDTWFSSALWPFSTLGWPEKTEEFKNFYPTNVLVTGFDIIFFWVARMIMMGIKFTGEVPFREVYIHGLVRDAEGQKMSKSKGNVLDPIDLIDGIQLENLVQKRTSGLMKPDTAPTVEKATRSQFPEGIPAFGTDALRFTFAALASTGRDIRFDTGRIEGYRHFCNKLWNASRFVLMNLEGHDLGTSDQDRRYSLADRWIRSRLHETIKAAHEAFRTYRFDLLANVLYEFTWNEYCDWYVELTKPVLQSDDVAAARGARYTLVSVLETILRLIHPLMPFITEEIWQKVAPLANLSGDTIMLQNYPTEDSEIHDPVAIEEMRWIMDCILGIRKIRGEMNINPGKALPVLLQGGGSRERERMLRNQVFLKSLARLESVRWLDPSEPVPEAATALVGDLKLLVPMAGVIDKQAERARLAKEITRLRKELAAVETKLANANFVDRAPSEIVTKERQRATDLRQAVTQFDEQLARIERW